MCLSLGHKTGPVEGVSEGVVEGEGRGMDEDTVGEICRIFKIFLGFFFLNFPARPAPGA